MLTLNVRVAFRGELCQVVSVTPAGSNSLYKLKHIESDKVLDGDFIEDDLEQLDPVEAAEKEKELLEAGQKRVRELTGDAPMTAGAVRDQKLALMFPADVELPVREDKGLGAPIAPNIPGVHEDGTSSRIGGEGQPNDYSNSDGSFTAAGRAAQDSMRK